MNEQKEKVSKASTGEEESRYSQLTLFDLRNNLAGTKTAYAVFQSWLVSHASTDPTKDGKTADQSLTSDFAALDAVYSSYQGDALPTPPATWSAVSPSAADLATPFGKLYTAVTSAVDPEKQGSVVFVMNDAADILGFPRFRE
jgi:iron uptake system component EfeO